jgi:hypothetical protein
MLMMLLSGVRSSWLTLARNWPFTREASRASTSAWARSRLVCARDRESCLCRSASPMKRATTNAPTNIGALAIDFAASRGRDQMPRSVSRSPSAVTTTTIPALATSQADTSLRPLSARPALTHRSNASTVTHGMKAR